MHGGGVFVVVVVVGPFHFVHEFFCFFCLMMCAQMTLLPHPHSAWIPPTPFSMDPLQCSLARDPSRLHVVCIIKLYVTYYEQQLFL